MRGLSKRVKASLEKATDSAILAVEVYNKPAVKFKSGGYICLMVIAWTSLFHAIFLKKNIKPFYRQKMHKGRFAKIDGEYKFWELDECVGRYFGTEGGNPIRKNLELFIPLRNKIEHRSMPELDSSIFGECQALLLNFDEILEKEFGKEYCIRELLSFSLQLFPSAQNLVEAVKRNPAAKPIIEFIQRYRSTVSPEIQASGKYAFKAFLIQVTNNQSQDAVAVQFVHYDKLSDDQKKELSQLTTLIKPKATAVLNLDRIKASEVVKRVQQKLGNPKVLRNGRQVDKFTVSAHTACWRKYKARPSSDDQHPEATNPEFCTYDALHEDYGYTEAWVDFVVEKMKIAGEYDSLISYLRTT